jgi:transposase InsO family protein
MPFQVLSADHTGPLGEEPTQGEKYKQMLVVVDHLTRFCFIIPVKTSSAAETIRAFHTRVFPFTGIPRVLICDQGSDLMSQQFKAFADGVGMRLLPVPQGASKSNGLAERNIRYLHSLFRRWVGNGVSWKKWDELVPYAEAVMRSRPSKKKGATPYEALLGMSPRFPLDHDGDDTSNKLLGKDELWAAARDDYRDIIFHSLLKAQKRSGPNTLYGNATYPFKEGDIVRRHIKVARRTSTNKDIHGGPHKWYRGYTEQWLVLEDHGTGRFLCQRLYPAWPKRTEILDGANLKKHGAGLEMGVTAQANTSPSAQPPTAPENGGLAPGALTPVPAVAETVDPRADYPSSSSIGVENEEEKKSEVVNDEEPVARN